MTIAQEEAQLKEKLAELAKSRREREIVEALDAGAIPQGVRLVIPGAEEGVTFVFTPEEGASLVDNLRKMAKARIEGAKQ
jgi:hypothetical protein